MLMEIPLVNSGPGPGKAGYYSLYFYSSITVPFCIQSCCLDLASRFNVNLISNGPE